MERRCNRFHTVYKTAIHGHYRETAVPAKLRVWTTSSDVFYPDNTVVFVIGKLFAPANNTFLLECVYMGNVPGDPSDPLYQETVPELDAGPFVVVVGQVIKPADSSHSGILKSFTVTASDYVRDEQKFSQVLYVRPMLTFHLLTIS
jgi:hypothetical protein